MKQKTTPDREPTEIKERIPLWLYPSTLQAVDRAMERGNYKSRSDFIERAALFYAGYLSGEDACDFLPPALVEAIRGTMHDGENRIARLLFKNAVELDMMMHVLAAGLEISGEDLQKLRGKCVQEVKKTNGAISLHDAVDFQKGL